jgi:hypothetical protein
VLENSVTAVTRDTPGSIAKVIILEFFIFSSRKGEAALWVELMAQLPRWPPLGNPTVFSRRAEKESNLFCMLSSGVWNVKLIYIGGSSPPMGSEEPSELSSDSV